MTTARRNTRDRPGISDRDVARDVSKRLDGLNTAGADPCAGRRHRSEA
jgi:hypothetical protein